MTFDKFSIGFKSGDCAGHGITSICYWLNHSLTNLLVCLGSLSCWNVHIKDISSSVYGRMSFLSIFTKTCWPMISSIKRMGPTPLYEKHAHTMILRPPAQRSWDFVLGGTRCLVVDGHIIMNLFQQKPPAKTHLSKGYIGLLKVASSSGFWQTSTCLWGVFYQVMAPLVDF